MPRIVNRKEQVVFGLGQPFMAGEGSQLEPLERCGWEPQDIAMALADRGHVVDGASFDSLRAAGVSVACGGCGEASYSCDIYVHGLKRAEL